jgi:hypothetical protein
MIAKVLMGQRRGRYSKPFQSMKIEPVAIGQRHHCAAPVPPRNDLAFVALPDEKWNPSDG